MFLEIIPEAYDIDGHKSYKPHLNKRLPPPTFPFGRYLSRPLAITCNTLEDVRKFALTCKQQTDEKAFGKQDYWLPPDEFEIVKKGDCDDFALWTWRQLLKMGYRARFVVGRFGRYGAGHTWVAFEQNGKRYIADATLAAVGAHLPRLVTLRYHPIYSVSWDGHNVGFYSHAKESTQVGVSTILLLVPAWLWFWTKMGIRIVLGLLRLTARYILRLFEPRRSSA